VGPGQQTTGTIDVISSQEGTSHVLNVGAIISDNKSSARREASTSFIAKDTCSIINVRPIDDNNPYRVRLLIDYDIPYSWNGHYFIHAYIPSRQNNTWGQFSNEIPVGRHSFEPDKVVELEYRGGQDISTSSIELVISGPDQIPICSDSLAWGKRWQGRRCTTQSWDPTPGLHPWSGRARPGFDSIDAQDIGKLARLRRDIRKWAFRCNGSMAGGRSGVCGDNNDVCSQNDDCCSLNCKDQRCTKPFHCPTSPSDRICDNTVNMTGDSNLYDGILCLSGEGSDFCGFGVHCSSKVGTQYNFGPSCKAVQNAQGKDGRWWRSADNVGLNCERSFSRDMALGTLAYLARTHDTNAALNWWNYIENNDELLCPDDKWYDPVHDMCGIYHNLWSIPDLVRSTEYFGIFHDVWEKLGLTPSPIMEELGSYGADDDRIDHACNWLEGADFFQILLVADQYFIKQYLSTDTSIDQKGIDCLVKVLPENPYIQFLKEGASNHVAELTLQRCPASPLLVHNKWMRDIVECPQLWCKTSGWDCIFMINLLIGPEADRDADGIDDFLEVCPEGEAF
jgi:hypothetical protein